MSSTDAKDVLREWRESAPYWAKHAAMVRSMFAPITAALIEAVALEKTDFALDVAGGSGDPSISMAEEIGASGSVICTDAVAEMVLATCGKTRELGLTNIEFSQCIAEQLPFSSDTFDVVACRLGIMLFPDPLAAITEILRVAKPGGRVGFAVWGEREANPFFHVVANIVSHYVESPPENPDAPGAFRFAAPGKLAALLADAGAIDVTERLLSFTLEAPLTPSQFWEMRRELSDTLRAKIAGLSTDQVQRLAREVEDAGRAFQEGGRMRFPAAVLIVSGRKEAAAV